MKRTTATVLAAATVTAATAMGLGATPAHAKTTDPGMTSSYNAMLDMWAKRFEAAEGDQEQMDKVQKQAKSSGDVIRGSSRRDIEHDRKQGTTFDAVVGTGVTAAVLGLFAIFKL